MRLESWAFLAVAAAFSLAACSGSGDREEADGDRFCVVAGRFNLAAQEDFGVGERQALLEELAELGPLSLADDFHLLASSIDDPADSASVVEAGERVGRFIQERCPEVNLPGIAAPG